MTPASKDLISRLRGRYPVGQIMPNGEPEFGYRDMSGPASVMIPPAIDLEAANHIERLEKELASLKRALPARLPGQLATDVAWRRVQPDLFCGILSDQTVFDGGAIERTWNAMRDALLKREASALEPILANLNAEVKAVLTQYGADIWNKAHQDLPEDYRPAVVKAGDELVETLWQVARIFGPALYNGNTQIPFQDNVISITDTRTGQ